MQNCFFIGLLPQRNTFANLYTNGNGKSGIVKPDKSRNREKRPWPIERAENSKVRSKKNFPKYTGIPVSRTKMWSKTAIFGCLLENKISNKQTNIRPNIYFEKSSEFFSEGWSPHQNSFRCSYWSKKILLKKVIKNGKNCSKIKHLLENKITNKQTNKTTNIYFEKSSEFFSERWSPHQNSLRWSYWSV